MSIDKWDECFTGINSIELNFEDLSRRSFASLTSSYLCLHEVTFSLQGKLNRVCCVQFYIYFSLLYSQFYSYITKPPSALFEISKPSSIIFKLCIFVTTLYLDSIYLLQIQRPPASFITWYSCSTTASLSIKCSLRPVAPHPRLQFLTDKTDRSDIHSFSQGGYLKCPTTAYFDFHFFSGNMNHYYQSLARSRHYNHSPPVICPALLDHLEFIILMHQCFILPFFPLLLWRLYWIPLALTVV